MSYDYNNLVQEIQLHLRSADSSENPQTHWQSALQALDTLSSHCPMTPRLWILYAHTAYRLLSNEKLRLQTLQLALQEFPGSALLHWYYCSLLQRSHESSLSLEDIETAIQQVGKGSHPSEEYVTILYRWYAETSPDSIEPWIQRARFPCPGNAALAQEFQTHHADGVPRLQAARKAESIVFRPLESYEQDIQIALNSEGIPTNVQLETGDELINVDWNPNFGMGLGGTVSTQAFIAYADALVQAATVKDHDDDIPDEVLQHVKIIRQQLPQVARWVYERAIAECPTVEALWLAYLNYLSQQDNDNLSGELLLSVAQRACRNCPYSVRLVQEKLQVSLKLAMAQQAVLDPDQLVQWVQHDALESKFIQGETNAWILYKSIFQTIKRYILFRLAQNDHLDYDAPQPMDYQVPNNVLDDEMRQELEDLSEDLIDLYDFVEEALKRYSWSESRALLWKDKARTMTLMLKPLQEKRVAQSTADKEDHVLQSYRKASHVQNPAHPDTYSLYIQYHLSRPISSPAEILSRIRTSRFLYQKALRAVGRPKASSTFFRDFDMALSNICHQYLDFEQDFGSTKSLELASNEVEKKLRKAASYLSSAEPSRLKRQIETSHLDEEREERSKRFKIAETSEKNHLGAHVSDEVDTKAQIKLSKISDKNVAVTPKSEHFDSETEEAQDTTNIKSSDKHKGVHPFTIRVSNLSPATEDMDLVDLFRPKCGSIVHARIVRDKHHHDQGRSKGWGLVQFEREEGVEKALELSEVIGHHERLLKIERSYMPAVGLVPPGHHRVKEKGAGRSSKRNQKRNDRGTKETERKQVRYEGEGRVTVDDPVEFNSASQVSLLSFRPRGVDTRKQKVALNRKD